MDYGKSFTFLFDDRDWGAKLVIGSVFLLIPVVGWLWVIGYGLDLIRNVAEGRSNPLPAWTGLGDKFVHGLIVGVVFFVIFIPSWFVTSCIAPVFSGMAGATGTDFGIFLMTMMVIGLNLLSGLYSLLVLIITPALLIRYAITRDFGRIFSLSEGWDLMKANAGNYILILVFGIIVLPILASVGSIACFIGVIFTSFWAVAIFAHQLGQYYREYGSPSAALTEYSG